MSGSNTCGVEWMAPMGLCALACSSRSGTAHLSGFDERGMLLAWVVDPQS